MFRRYLIARTVICVLAAKLASAADPIEPALEPDATVQAKLNALGDNSCCILEDMTIIEDLGDFAKGWHRMKETGPAGRDFTIKMAWMPDRKRAFFCGANHNSPHRFNDAWEYDLASNTWVLLYTPDYNDRGPITDYDRQTLVLKDGWLRTKKGGPAHPAHTWWGLTYDPEQKMVLWYCAWPPYRLQDKLDAIGATKEDLYPGPPLWAFHPGKKRWEPIPTDKPWPRDAFGASLEYIPELGGSLWQYRDHTWLFDTDKRSWTLLCERETKAIWSYDPGKIEWTKLAPQGPPPPFASKERVVAYMDLARNVFVVIGYGRVWCYRYRDS